MENLFKLRKLRKEAAGLRHSIDTMKPEIQVDYYKDYRTGKGIPKPLTGYAFDTAKLAKREKMLESKLKQITKAIEKAEAEIESIVDPEDRIIARLYYIDELTQSEIGSVLNMERSNVSKRLKKIHRL